MRCRHATTFHALFVLSNLPPFFNLTTLVKPLRSGRGSCGSDQIDSGTQTHKRKIPTQSRDEVASQAGFEPAASCLEGSRSIH